MQSIESPNAKGLFNGDADMRFGVRDTLPDPDPVVTQEWIESILAVAEKLGDEEARRLLIATVNAAQYAGVAIDLLNTPYLNPIHPSMQGKYPLYLAMDTKLSLIPI